jgi:hypothetical protein
LFFTIEYGEIAAESYPRDKITRWRFLSAKRALTLAGGKQYRGKIERSADASEASHGLLSPFPKKVRIEKQAGDGCHKICIVNW